jgi:hypothetical protein
LRCGECGTENGSGVEFCADCGKTLAIALGALSSDPGEDAAAAASLGFTPPTAMSFGADAECNLCQKSCPSESLQTVDGTAFCPECAPFMAAGGDAESDGCASPRLAAPFSPGPAQPVPEPVPGAPEPSPYGGPEPARSSSLEPPAYSQSMRGLSADSQPTHGFPSERPIFVEKPARRFPFVAVALLVVVAVGGFLLWHFFLGRDRIDLLLAEAEASDRTVSLVPKLEQGQTWRYAADVTVDFQMSGVAGDESFEFSAEGGLDAGFYLDVLDVNASGTATLQMAIENVNVNMELDGTIPGLGQTSFSKEIEEFEGQTFEVKMDRRGRLVGGGGQSELTSILALAEDVPDGPISVGETWQQTVSMPGDMPGGGGELTVNYRLVGFARHLGHDCAVIEVDGSTELAEKQVAMEVDMKGAMFLDAEDGHLVHLALDMSLEATMTMMGSFSMDLALTMDVKQQ